jgi:phospholipase C
MSAAENVGANFNAGYGLTVSLPGAGTGTVTSNPKGINCAAGSTTGCSASFAQGTQITLTEAAVNGNFFSGWSGGCTSTSTTCAVTLNASANVSATFNPGYGLTVAVSGFGSGTVTSKPAGIDCATGSTTGCSASFAQGTQITLSETPGTNWVFAGWSGGCSGTTGCTVTLNNSSSVSAAFGTTLQAINHIIVFAQENRSFDHYFGAMRQYWADNGFPDQQFDGLPQFNPSDGNPPPGNPPTVPGCAAGTWGASCSVDPTNQIASFHFENSVCQENQSPFWNEAHNQWDYADPTGSNANDLASPPLNGFVYTAAYDAAGDGFMDVEGVRAMGYYDGTDLNYYYYLASSFATSDRWFAPIMSRTQLNRMYLLAATSYGYAYPIGDGVNDSQQLPSTTIFEALQNAGITWKIYMDPTGLSDSQGSCPSMTGADLSTCLVQNSYINQFQYENTILNNSTLLANVQPSSQFAIDAANNQLPQFALIEPASAAGLDEHPSDSDEYVVNVQEGEGYVASNIINPLMQSPSWASSALIFAYDEWGGYYDHVAPAAATPPGDFTSPTDLNPALNDICTGSGQLGTGICDFAWTGFRVPAIVISPFANKNYVSHTPRDTTSVLNLVEERFGINALTGRDGAQPKMDEFFNFVNPPWMTPPTPPTPTEYNSQTACNQVPPASWNEPPVISVAVNGGGTISSNPSGINCSTDEGIACGATFPTGTVVTLTATPNSGGTFSGWSLPSCSGSTPTCQITADTNYPVYVQANFLAQ